MAQWSPANRQTLIDHFDYQYMSYQPCYQEIPMPPPQQPPLVNYQSHSTPQAQSSTIRAENMAMSFQKNGSSSKVPESTPGPPKVDEAVPNSETNELERREKRRENPREIRNKAEKKRRDKLNQSIAELASIVPPVAAAPRKVDKTTVLRLTAHYLRANQHVFGDSVSRSRREFSVASMLKTMGLFNGFLITVTYRGIVVVVSQNVEQYLGYTELDLVGQNLLNFTHEADREILRRQLMPISQNLGANGELLYPNEPGAQQAVDRALALEKRNFVIRIRKARQRSEPSQYMTCRIEGAMRRSDRATGGSNRSKQVVRRCRARSDNPYSSGNDIVFIAMVRPYTQPLINERLLEASRMEYRTRHTIDGLIVHCDSRIAMVTGYTAFEVCGLNAMNFMHRDDVRWVVLALREMYDHQRMYGESCYRLITKNGQFIYMKTQGYLEVDRNSRECSSFVCTNTVVDNKEGKHLIQLMRKKFAVIASKTITVHLPSADEEIIDVDNDHQIIAIVHPSHLGPVVLDLLVNLPFPPLAHLAVQAGSPSRLTRISYPQRITFIPPSREKIVNGIERIYDLIKDLRNEPTVCVQTANGDGEYPRASTSIYDNPVASTSQEGKFPNNPTVLNATLSANKMCINGNESITVTENETTSNDDAPSDLGFLDDWPDYWALTSHLENQNIKYVHEDGQVFYLGYHDYLFLLLIIYLIYSSLEMIWSGVMNQTVPEPSTNQTSNGIKRTNNFEVVDTTKKQIKEVVSQSTSSSVLCSNVSSTNKSDDEFSDDPGIDAVLNSLSTFEPTLPELMATLNDDEFSKYLEQFEMEQDYND